MTATDPFTFIPGASPAEVREARSRAYSPATFVILRLASGRWAAFNDRRELLIVADDLTSLTPTLEPLADIAQRAHEAWRERFAAAQAEAQAKPLTFGLDDLELDL